MHVTAPPSPLVIGFTGWKLKTTASLYLQSPINEFLYFEPNAWEASSTILNLYFFDKSFSFSKLHGLPPKCTGTKILGNLLYFFA